MGNFYFIYTQRCDCFLLLFCQSHVLLLTAHGVTLTSEINHDLLHLQYQFMIAAFSIKKIPILTPEYGN